MSNAIRISIVVAIFIAIFLIFSKPSTSSENIPEITVTESVKKNVSTIWCEVKYPDDCVITKPCKEVRKMVRDYKTPLKTLHDNVCHTK